MLPNELIRSLFNALSGLIVLICLSLCLLGLSAFLYAPDEPQPVNSDWEGPHRETSVADKPAPLTEQQLHGKQLFVNNCAQCHAVTEDVVVGPGLKGVTVRAPGEAWLMKWIRNSSVLVASGDPYAVQVFNKFNKIQMSSFPNLTNADIRAILAYVDGEPTATP